MLTLYPCHCGRPHPECNILHTSCLHVWGCRHHDHGACTCPAPDEATRRLKAEGYKLGPALTVVQGGLS